MPSESTPAALRSGAARASRRAPAVLEHEQELPVPLDRGPEALLEVLDRCRRSVASQRPSSTTTFIPRAIAPQSSIVAGRTSIAPA